MLDTVNVTLCAGKGGDGAVSFLREKFRPKGGPDGGDGGDGGAVIVRASGHLRSLNHLEGVRKVAAQPGSPGRSKNRTGRKGRPVYVDVAVGTVVWERALAGEREFLTELLWDGSEVLVAHPGNGGAGNTRLATPTNQEPLLAYGGEPGEERCVEFEVKLLADVGLVGAPNAGKSTLLSTVSRAKPKVADYPFTTLEPVLGVADVGGRSLVMLDIPGLIEGAHEGRGLGLEFLRHCERTAVLVQLVDGMADDLAGEYSLLDGELTEYAAGLEAKPRLVVVTKLDIPEARDRFRDQRSALQAVAGQDPLGITAVTGEGIAALLSRVADLVPVAVAPPEEQMPQRVSRQRRPPPQPRVTRLEDCFEVRCPPAERLLEASDLGPWRARMQFHNELERLGVIEALQRAGAVRGDTVRIAEFEFTWE